MTTYIEPKPEEEKLGVWDYLKAILISVLIIFLVFLSMNQIIGYVYKAEILMNPCNLCAKITPDFRECVEATNQYQVPIQVVTPDDFYYNLTKILVPPNGR